MSQNTVNIDNIDILRQMRLNLDGITKDEVTKILTTVCVGPVYSSASNPMPYTQAARNILQWIESFKDLRPGIDHIRKVYGFYLNRFTDEPIKELVKTLSEMGRIVTR